MMISFSLSPVPLCQESSPRSARNGNVRSRIDKAVTGSAPVNSANTSLILPLSAPLEPVRYLILSIDVGIKNLTSV